MIKLPIILTITSALLLSGCASTPVSKDIPSPSPSLTTSDMIDPSVTALLPTGANDFTFVQKLKGSELAINGYINFEDCSTDATALMDANGVLTSFEIRNSGSGEAIRKAKGVWYPLEDEQGPGLGILTPMSLLEFTVEQERGVACSILLLDDLSSAGVATGSTTPLKWDYERTATFVARATDLFGIKVFLAYGATEEEIADSKDLRQSLFNVDPSVMMGRLSASISVDTNTTVISFLTESGEVLGQYRFTPTEPRYVEPVTFTPWYDKLRADAKSSGLTFIEQLSGK